MKYWKGIIGTSKEGQTGTVDSDGFVPDSIECTKEEYELAHPVKTELQLTIESAKKGDIRAIKKLIELKGGWTVLTAVQKEKVMKLILGYAENL